MEEKKNGKTRHALVVPFPGQGHLNPMLQFSKVLISKGLTVTLLVTNFIAKHNHHQLLSSSLPHHLQFDTISDGYDESGFKQAGSLEAYISTLNITAPQSLEELIKKYQVSSNPIDFVVYDSFCGWAVDIAKQFGLKSAAFFTHTCAVDYIFYNYFHRKIMSPETPVRIKGLPVLEIQDLPSFIAFPESYPVSFEMIMSQFYNLDKADFILTNTFYKLESEVVDAMSEECPNLLTIGPAVPSFYFDKSIENDKDYGLDLPRANPSVDLMSWLSRKAAGSVVYVAFGSLGNINKEQLEEIAWGLLNSNFHFLWIVRNSEKANLPKDFMENLGEKGLLVNWCSQVKVLSNEAIGCFVSHCGWNSTIEALSLGVPMVALPQWSDQTTNSKFVEDVWRVGIRAKVSDDDSGIVKRGEIELRIKQVMVGVRGKEIKNNSKKWKELAIEAVNEGGTSHTNVSQLVSTILYSKT